MSNTPWYVLYHTTTNQYTCYDGAYRTPGTVFQGPLLNNQEGANAERYEDFGNLSARCFPRRTFLVPPLLQLWIYRARKIGPGECNIVIIHYRKRYTSCRKRYSVLTYVRCCVTSRYLYVTSEKKSGEEWKEENFSCRGSTLGSLINLVASPCLSVSVCSSLFALFSQERPKIWDLNGT